jgi:hypothetical protein
MRPTESCGTFRRTSGAVEEDMEMFAEVEIVTPLPVNAVPERPATFEPLDVVGGVVRSLEVAVARLVGGEVGGGIAAEVVADFAKMPGWIRSRAPSKRTNRFQRDTIAENERP